MKIEEQILEMRTTTISRKGQICIPNCLRSINPKFKEGTKVLIIIFNDKIEIKPLPESLKRC